MTGIPGPIQGEAQRLGLTSDAATRASTAGRGELARLDEEELQALERAEYYGGADPVPGPTPARSGLLGRLRDWLRHPR